MGTSTGSGVDSGSGVGSGVDSGVGSGVGSGVDSGSGVGDVPPVGKNKQTSFETTSLNSPSLSECKLLLTVFPCRPFAQRR